MSVLAAKSDPRLIVALDVADVDHASHLVNTLGDSISFYKIGLELAFTGGIDLAKTLKARGKQVFLDVKLHDIPNTVERACRQISNLGVDFLTIHAYPQTLQAARAGCDNGVTKLLAVTVMTSYDDKDLEEAGFGFGVLDLVIKRAQTALNLGIDGVIAAPTDVGALRATLGDTLTFVTPGIRPQGAANQDQKRILTPKQALAAGANYLVIGRPITAAPDPLKAAHEILDSIT